MGNVIIKAKLIKNLMPCKIAELRGSLRGLDLLMGEG